jgi:hypothetical protein
MTDEPLPQEDDVQPRDEELAEGQTSDPAEDQPWADRPEQTGGGGLRTEPPD